MATKIQHRALLLVSVSMAGWCSAAHAQSVDTVEGQEPLVVIGNRAVDTPAEEIKRKAQGIVDSITARDVARTPDTTLAEALDRVVGASSDKFTQTTEAGSVSVRGFDARYNSMDIDGTPVWFTSQNNRGAQLAIFPASIVNQINVYKTVTADQDGNSVGGHIGLRTLRAFDGGTRPYLSLGARIGAHDQPGETEGKSPSYRLYGATKGIFGPDGALGFVLGFDAQRTNAYDRYAAVDGYTQVSGEDYVNGGIYQGRYDKNIRRNAAYAKLEARSSDRLYAFTSVNLFDENTRQYLQRSGVYVYQSSGRTTGFDDGRAAFNKAVGQTKEYDYDIHRRALLLASGMDYRFDDSSVIELRGSVTDYHYDVDLAYPETFQMTGLAGRYDVSRDTPSAVVETADFGDPAKWVYRNSSASYQQRQRLSDNVYSGRIDYVYNGGGTRPGLGLKTGISFTRLDRRYDQTQDNYKLPGGAKLLLSQVAPAGSSVADNSAVETDWSAFWTYMKANGTMTQDAQQASDYQLDEDVGAAYASLGYGVGGLQVLAGLRYEQTWIDNRAFDTAEGATGPVDRHRSYANWLPNAQIRFDILPNLRIRAAYTRTIGRPDFADFAMGRTTTLDGLGNPVIKGVNPRLNPRVSDNMDFAVETYFTGGYASLGLFSKSLKDETFTQRTQQFDAGGVPILTEEVPLNTGSARVRGLEASLVLRRFGFLPAPLNGFGLTLNYTYLDGRWDVVFTDGAQRSVDGLRNQPKWLGNVALSYDAGPLDLNLAWRVRGRTFTGTFGTTAAKDVWIDRYDQLDLQANLRLQKRWRLFFEARNLTDRAWRQITGATGVTSQESAGGRSYFAGLKYRY